MTSPTGANRDDPSSAGTPATVGASTAIGDVRAASFERLRAIFERAPIGIGIVRFDEHTILANTALRDILGYSAEEFATIPFSDYTHPDDVERNRELLAEMAAGKRERFEMDKRFYHRDGHVIWCRLTVSALREGGDPELAIGMLQDITEQRRLETELQEAEETYRLLVEQTPAVVYVAGLAHDAPWRYVSPQIERVLGYAADEWLADPGMWLRHMHPEDRDAAIAAKRSPSSGEGPDTPLVHYRMHHRDGSEVWVRDEFAVVTDRDGEPVLRGVLLDVTRQKQLEATLEQQAFHDALTGLANRALFSNRVEHCLQRAERDDRARCAVVFLDLDDFKTVNDSLGHAAGDELLCSVAERISSSVRPGDTAARFGGDEFAVLLEDIDSDEHALRVAERVLGAIEQPHRLRDKTVMTSTSIGIAYGGDAVSTEALMRNADLAMYHAKEGGKGRIARYRAELHQAAVRRLDIRTAIEGAIEREELELRLQPIVDLRTGAMLAAEALLRWEHPQFGPVAPTDFIPVAEETGVITRMGEWVLRHGCEWLARRRAAAGSSLALHVNVSPLQLRDGLLPRAIEHCTAENGVDPSDLVLEVPEGGLRNDRSHRALGELKATGVRIGIDDFGAGHASLSSVSELPVDLIKLDRRFVGNLTTDCRTHAVPRAALHLAESLGLGIVAEGVETEEQRAWLQLIGYRSGQGFLFARPSAPELLDAARPAHAPPRT